MGEGNVLILHNLLSANTISLFFCDAMSEFRFLITTRVRSVSITFFIFICNTLHAVKSIYFMYYAYNGMSNLAFKIFFSSFLQKIWKLQITVLDVA